MSYNYLALSSISRICPYDLKSYLFSLSKSFQFSPFLYWMSPFNKQLFFTILTAFHLFCMPSTLPHVFSSAHKLNSWKKKTFPVQLVPKWYNVCSDMKSFSLFTNENKINKNKTKNKRSITCSGSCNLEKEKHTVYTNNY